MKVRRFTAETMQKALKSVRNEMGPDAVILSNHRVSGGVEIIVAQNYEPKSANHVAPVYNDSHSPKKQDNKKKSTRNFSKKEEEPWPFLSEEERREVKDQLRLQDQLETIKHTKTSASSSGSSRVAKQDELTLALNSIKQDRERLSPLESLVKTDLNSAKPNSVDNTSKSEKQTNPLQNTPSNETALTGSNDRVQHQSQYNRKLIEDVKVELQDLKELLISGSSNNSANSTGSQPKPQSTQLVWKRYSPKNALQVTFWQRLEQMGFGDSIIYDLVKGVKPDDEDNPTWQELLREITQEVGVNSSDMLTRGGVYALVGPTGAGKTTTIAKMAVRYVLEHDERGVALITMDNYRLAAHDQLKTLGQILGVPVLVADEEHGLDGCIEQLSRYDLVLIDTAGLTPHHPMLGYQLERLGALKDRVSTLLTLPATSHSRVLRNVYHNYKAAGLTGCILTKVDEAGCLGDALSILLETKIQLSYYTDGQRIPDDIHVANATSLVKKTIQIAQHQQKQTPTHGQSIAVNHR